MQVRHRRWGVVAAILASVLLLLLWAFTAYLQPDMVLNFSTLLQLCGLR